MMQLDSLCFLKKDGTAIFLNVYFIILYVKMKDNGTMNIMAVNLMVHFLILQGCPCKQSLIFGISRKSLRDTLLLIFKDTVKLSCNVRKFIKQVLKSLSCYVYEGVRIWLRCLCIL